MKKRTKKFQLGGMTTDPNQEPIQMQGSAPNFWNSQNVPDSSQSNQNLQSNMKNLGISGYKKGGSVSTASTRGDGIAQRGKTRGRLC